MTDWNLFTNGAFKAKCRALDHSGPTIRKTIGHDDTSLLTQKGADRAWYRKEDCQLIARPIADLSDEEINNTPLIISVFGDKDEANDPEEIKRHLEIHAKTGYMNFADARYLLQRGVYPLPQSHFRDSVINANEIEEV